MGKSSPKQPKQPDPVVIGEQQRLTNAETARLQAQLNRTNETSPFGSLTYNQIGPDQFERQITLNPEQEQAIKAQQQLAAGLSGYANERLPAIQEILDRPITTDFSADRNKVESALLDRLNPYIQRDRDLLENRLVNQGIRPGQEAYGSEFDTFNKGVNDARLAAIIGAGQEQNRLFDLESRARLQPINEIAALLGNAQIQTPQFQGTPQTGVSPTDISSPFYQSYNNQYDAYNQQLNRNSQAASSNASILATLGAAAIAASSKDFKNDYGEVDSVLDQLQDIPVHSWTYKNEMGLDTIPHVGPFAEDWQEATGLGDGKHINLIDAFGILLKAVQELSAKVERLENAH